MGWVRGSGSRVVAGFVASRDVNGCYEWTLCASHSGGFYTNGHRRPVGMNFQRSLGSSLSQSIEQLWTLRGAGVQVDSGGAHSSGEEMNATQKDDLNRSSSRA